MDDRRRSKESSLDAAVLGAATIPLLFGTVSAQSLGQFFGALGEASEELFRGDRLPVLPFPVASDDLTAEDPEA
ncbi:MAG: hypothetical protein AAFY11_09180 [Cyanobacteria bacterium J06641_5]